MRVQRADLRSQGETVLTIPQDALVQTGSRNTVLLAEGNGYFRLVEVTAGQFLIDSEASLRGALPQLAGPTATNGGAAAPTESSGDDGHGGITTPQQADHQAGSHTTATPQIYRGEGTLKAQHGQRVTLAHGAVAALGWPAMTMDFILPKSGVPPAIHAGSRVQFAFMLDNNGTQLTDIVPVRSGQ
ncbi:MAG: copper-binding protein [Sodalis sp. (in: enterobacteria)]|uniref:copper-binding protein n=1 Tax=Sodalis sp. (in: enterobacteria) TaxID=1898979 RepID=UPI003F350DBE